jgi:beta-N-acetylhexosaminidase
MKFIRKIRRFATKHRRRLVLIGSGVATVFLVVIAANYLFIGRYDRYVIHDQAKLSQVFGQEKPVGIVLGGGITDDGKPMPLLQDRLDATASLLHQGRLSKVIVSGDNRFKIYDEPTAMRNYLVHEKGIDPELVQPDFAGRSTYETCERARKVFDVTQTLLISESTHLPRAIYLCRSFGVEAYGYVSDGQSSAGLKIGQRWREVLARTKASLNIYIMGEKTVLGEKIWQTTLDHNPFIPPAANDEFVQGKLAALSLHDKVASLFIVHTPGTDGQTLASYAAAHKVNGLIFMGDNMPATTEQLRVQTDALITDKQLLPLTSVDQEGGVIRRVPADTFPAAEQLRNQPPAATRSAFSQRSDMLRRAGLNLNFGIVADVTDDKNSFIYDRLLGTTPQAASERVTQAVIGSRGKTLVTLKHFPGHGEAAGDSHGSIPSTATSYEDWQKRAAAPFKAGIDAEADMVMFGHLRYSAVDQAPATLSKKWHQILRKDLGFTGIAITDDMIMLQNSGDPAYKDPVANAVAALQAGNELLLYVLNHNSEVSKVDVEVLISGVVAAVEQGKLDARLIDEYVQKVLTLRHHLATAY